MSQRGLAKLYRGDVRYPRLPFVQALIRAFPNEDPMWIVTGVCSGGNERARAIGERVIAIMQNEPNSPYADEKASSKRLAPGRQRPQQESLKFLAE